MTQLNSERHGNRIYPREEVNYTLTPQHVFSNLPCQNQLSLIESTSTSNPGDTKVKRDVTTIRRAQPPKKRLEMQTNTTERARKIQHIFAPRVSWKYRGVHC